MKESYTSKKRVRKNFGKIDAVIDMPGLIEVQTGSYDRFINNKYEKGNDKKKESNQKEFYDKLLGEYNDKFNKPIKNYSAKGSKV